MRRGLGWVFVKNMACNTTYGNKQEKTLQIKGKIANLCIGGLVCKKVVATTGRFGTIGTLIETKGILRMAGTMIPQIFCIGSSQWNIQCFLSGEKNVAKPFFCA